VKNGLHRLSAAHFGVTRQGA